MSPKKCEGISRAQAGAPNSLKDCSPNNSQLCWKLRRKLYQIFNYKCLHMDSNVTLPLQRMNQL